MAKRIVLPLVAVTGALVLSACGSSAPSKASGDLDDTKYLKSVKAVPAVTHKVTTQEAKTKKVCSGTGSKRKCKNVADGFKSVTKTVVDKPAKSGKSAMYCVELDNVNGDKDRDDQWFEVSFGTYYRWAGKPEGSRVTDLKYTSTLFRCSR